MNKNNINNHLKNINEELDDICENCGKEDSSVSQNLILISFKICNSCKISKTLFPI